MAVQGEGGEDRPGHEGGNAGPLLIVAAMIGGLALPVTLLDHFASSPGVRRRTLIPRLRRDK
ncbi:hypothetical protein [Streptomyces sp. NPDC060065]|uniref:hypothetical protein n=1 Tax=Streptomyces sp. NPDC060065 TaxID=3347050 RepID=UPI00367C22EE